MNTARVIENKRDNVIEHGSKADFITYLSENYEAMKDEPTRGLNIRHKIPGYKIGRKKGKIVLTKKVREDMSNSESFRVTTESRLDLLEEQMQLCMTLLVKLEK